MQPEMLQVSHIPPWFVVLAPAVHMYSIYCWLAR